MPPARHVVFIGEYQFPDGDAAAIRTLSLARLCRDLEYRVTVIGKGRLRAEDYDSAAGGYSIEGINYSTMNPARLTAVQRLRQPLRRLTLFATALAALDPREIRAVIINACDSARHVPLVKAYCERRSIPLIADVCEWYDPRQKKHGWLNPSYAIFRLVFHGVLPRVRNMIVVSRLLERRFAGSGRHLTRIPAPLDVANTSCADRTPADRLVLLYAGIPGRKDLLREIVTAMALLPVAERSRIEFRLLGPTLAELKALLETAPGLLDAVASNLKPMGRVPRARVMEALQEAHFSVLLRPDLRYANAGFPSKVAESLAAGTPVLLNFTSDLGEYLSDGTAAVPIHDCSVDEVSRSIRRALQLSPQDLTQLRRGARSKAERHFDYRLHLDSFGSFLNHLR